MTQYGDNLFCTGGTDHTGKNLWNLPPTGAGNDSSGPIRVFVGGCERSGTTFIGSLLQQWTGLVCLPESYFLLPVLRDAVASENLDVSQPILRHWRLRTWGLEQGRSEQALRNVKTPQQCMDALAMEINDRSAIKGWIDTTPFNSTAVDLLDRHFDNSKHINIVRDGRAVASSILRTDFGPGTVARAAQWWQASVLPGTLSAVSHPNRVLMVRYEDLITDPESAQARIVAFLGSELSTNEATNDQAPSENSVVGSYNKKTHALVGKPGDRTRIDAWKKELKPHQVKEFESMAGASLTGFGYELEYGIYPHLNRPLRNLDGVIDTAKTLFWKLPRRLLRRISIR